MPRAGSQLCVAKVPFFNHLEAEEMKQIANISKHHTIDKGEGIYQAHETLEYLYIVHIGRVKIYQLFESGKEQLLRLLEPGEFFGELALFTEKKLETYAEALEKTNICMIHRDNMQQLMIEHPTIALKILEQFSNRLDAADRLIGDLSVKDVETRIANYLLELMRKQATETIHLPMTKRDLASHLGTTQETISRRMTTMQEKGMIKQEGHRKVIIYDAEALRTIALDD